MNSGRKIGLMAVAALLMLTGCSNYDEEIVTSNTPVRVELAYTFSPSAAGNQTRQSSKVVVPNTSAPRLPDNLMIVPMKKGVPQKTETTWNEPVKRVSDRYTSLYYYSQYCDFEQGVDGCLVYGSADDVTPPTGVDSEVYNGNLIPSVNLSTVTDQSTSGLNNLTFDLEAIKDNTDVPTAASTLAGYLTDVANSHAGGQYWKNSDNVILKNLFDNFTNYGRNLPGSAASVKALLTALNTVANSYLTSSEAIGNEEKAILNAIITNTAADKVTAAIGDVTYPRNINLPDGAAALRWVEVEENNETVKKFMPQMQTTTLDDINTITRFTYPASLYYFVNSDIRTSDGMVSLPTEYNNITVEDTKTAWTGILGNFTAGGEVTATTRAVALTDPVQYAVAQLQVNTSYSTPSGKPANTLPDAVNANIEVDGKFLLKGVIICGQRPVNYNFVPGDNSDALTKFIYDSQVKEKCTLSASSTDAACTTLVLQSYEGEDVNIILEYENNSDDLTFKCVDGIVYPHTRFYLIGKVEALKGNDVINTDEMTHQVFTKDYITTVNMRVTSLAKAYNVLPNLLGGGLELGVELTTKWIQAETTNVLLNESD